MTTEEALAAWDAGEVIPTVQMGGIGPGYEQCIHLAVFEIIRDHVSAQLPIPFELSDWTQATLTRINGPLGGLTGAQWAAARFLAYHALRDGWDATIEHYPIDRRIMISRTFPHLPVPTSGK